MVRLDELKKHSDLLNIERGTGICLFKMLLHDIATETSEKDEYEAAVEAAIQLLMDSEWKAWIEIP